MVDVVVVVAEAAGGAVWTRDLGVADLDLAPGGQAAVIGGEPQVELGDDAFVALRPGRRGAVDGLAADDELPPVADRAPCPRDRLSADDGGS